MGKMLAFWKILREHEKYMCSIDHKKLQRFFNKGELTLGAVLNLDKLLQNKRSVAVTLSDLNVKF